MSSMLAGFSGGEGSEFLVGSGESEDWQNCDLRQVNWPFFGPPRSQGTVGILEPWPGCGLCFSTCPRSEGAGWRFVCFYCCFSMAKIVLLVNSAWRKWWINGSKIQMHQLSVEFSEVLMFARVVDQFMGFWFLSAIPAYSEWNLSGCGRFSRW